MLSWDDCGCSDSPRNKLVNKSSRWAAAAMSQLRLTLSRTQPTPRLTQTPTEVSGKRNNFSFLFTLRVFTKFHFRSLTVFGFLAAPHDGEKVYCCSLITLRGRRIFMNFEVLFRSRSHRVGLFISFWRSASCSSENRPPHRVNIMFANRTGSCRDEMESN